MLMLPQAGRWTDLRVQEGPFDLAFGGVFCSRAELELELDKFKSRSESYPVSSRLGRQPVRSSGVLAASACVCVGRVNTVINGAEKKFGGVWQDVWRGQTL